MKERKRFLMKNQRIRTKKRTDVIPPPPPIQINKV
jgi:hypothetical protein